MSEFDTWWEAMIDTLFEGVYFADRERRILLWNKGAERICGHRAEDVLNRRCSEAALCHIDGSGTALCGLGCPLTRAMTSGEQVESEAFLLHRDGHRLPVRIRARAVRDRAGEVIGVIETFESMAPTSASEVPAAGPHSALLDPVTGTSIERIAIASIQSRLAQVAREGTPLGVLAIKPDRLEFARGTFGESAGTALLRMVARTLASNAGPQDIVSRRANDTLLVVLPDSDVDELTSRADRLRILVERSALPFDMDVLRTTVSVGAAAARISDTPEVLLQRAESLMERSVRSGGGCVSTETSEPMRRLPVLP